MTQLILRSPLPDALSGLMALLERYSAQIPALEEELSQQRALAALIAEHERRGEQALNAWRAALSARWTHEVAAQRAYSAVQRQLADYYGADLAYAQLIAPSHADSVGTPSALLHEVRRLEASLELLIPQPGFAAAALERLRLVGDELALAIDRTTRCESERRSVVSEQRMAANLSRRAYDRARSALVRHLGEQQLALPPHAEQ